MRAPAKRAIETLDGRVVDAELPDARLGYSGQFSYALDGVDLRGEAR
jgi:hypothetical protein